MNPSGHYWTLRARLALSGRLRLLPPAREWEVELQDPVQGRLRLSGELREEGGPCLLVVVHGLGGSCASQYAVRSARAARRAGISCLRLNLRGADGRGEDFYHAGLTADLHAVLGAADLRRFETVWIVGFSLGGHLALRFATETADPRVRAVVAICPPLDLDATCRAIDGPGVGLYRAVMLRSLKRTYEAVAARGPVPTPMERIRRIRRIREWDELTVAPRHGFDSAEDYYSQMSVGPRLGDLRVPGLLVASTRDPLVPPEVVRPSVAARPPLLTIRWLDRGGHVGFPGGLDLGERAAPGVESQTLAWLRRHARAG